MQEVRNVRIVSCKNIVKSIKCREIRYCSVKIFTESNRTMIKEGRKMNFNNKKTRRIVSIVVLIVIIAMVATMIIPYLV